MDYLDLYRRRTSADGFTEQERITNKLSRDFLQLMRRSPNKEYIKVGDKTYETVIQSGNSRVGTQTEKKVIQYLLTPRDCLLPEGTKFYTTDVDGQHVWLILHREVHSSYGYFKYKIIELNHKIKYVNAQGVMKVLETFINGTHEFDIKEYFAFSNTRVLDKPTRALNLIYPTTSDIDQNCRFYIGGDTWKFIDADIISIPGVSYGTIFLTATNEQETDKKEQISNTDRLNNSIIISSFGPEETIQLTPQMNFCKFFMLTDQKLMKTSFHYETNNSSIFEIVSDTIVPKQVGTATLKVNTPEGLEKNFTIEVANEVPKFLNLIGSTRVKETYEQVFTIISNYDNVVFSLEDDSYGTLTTDKNNLIFTARSKIGKTKILCYAGGNLIKTIPIEITSLYI